MRQADLKSITYAKGIITLQRDAPSVPGLRFGKALARRGLMRSPMLTILNDYLGPAGSTLQLECQARMRLQPLAQLGAQRSARRGHPARAVYLGQRNCGLGDHL